MRMSPQCEKEGCTNLPKWFIHFVERGWVWLACDEHEAVKEPGELSVAIPFPPPPP